MRSNIHGFIVVFVVSVGVSIGHGYSPPTCNLLRIEGFMLWGLLQALLKGFQSNHFRLGVIVADASLSHK